MGEPRGAQTSFTITPAGGEFTSPDKSLKLIVPAGAVSANTVCSMQAVEKTAPAGLGTSMRLLPHGTQFVKPVTIQFSYADREEEVGAVLGLGLAFQDEKGFWYLAENPVVNQTAKTVSVTTTHFSDWTLAHWFKLIPTRGSVVAGEELGLQVVSYSTSSSDPFKTSSKVLMKRDAKPLDAKYIKNSGKGAAWQVGGPGEVIGSGSGATYKAPGRVDKPTEASVSVELTDPDGTFTGQYLLIANLTVLPDEGLHYRIDNKPWQSEKKVNFIKVGPSFYQLGLLEEREVLKLFIIEWQGEVGSHPWHYQVDPIPKYPTILSAVFKEGNDTYALNSYNYDKDRGYADCAGSITIEEMGKAGGNYLKGKFIVHQGGYISAKQNKEVARHTIEGYFTLKGF
ncbi:hypothetical protein ACFPMF_11585 [Larkinella bovis]|uniref:ZU5 domain-containing protein n=1 Tax=Larkinella bovis TaxID=683041 RepID=A0ABW0IBM8_9BACT